MSTVYIYRISLEYTMDCKTYMGEGSLPSNSTKGQKVLCTEYSCANGLVFDDYIKIEGINIDPRYLSLIKDYPDLEICVKPSRMFLFKSRNGIDVAIMGAY